MGAMLDDIAEAISALSSAGKEPAMLMSEAGLEQYRMELKDEYGEVLLPNNSSDRPSWAGIAHFATRMPLDKGFVVGTYAEILARWKGEWER